MMVAAMEGRRRTTRSGEGSGTERPEGGRDPSVRRARGRLFRLRVGVWKKIGIRDHALGRRADLATQTGCFLASFGRVVDVVPRKVESVER